MQDLLNKLELLNTKKALIEAQFMILNYQMKDIEGELSKVNVELHEKNSVDEQNRLAGNDGTSI